MDVRTEKIDISGEERFEYLVSLYEVLVLRKLSNAWNWIEIAVQRALARKIIKRYGTEGYIRWYVLSAHVARLSLIVTALQYLPKRQKAEGNLQNGL